MAWWPCGVTSPAASHRVLRLTFGRPERAATERRIAQAIISARQAGVSWSAIGSMLGTSGEAARKRQAVSTKTG